MSLEPIEFIPAAEPRAARAADPRPSAFSGAIDFLGQVHDTLHLACGWILGEEEAEPDLLWRAGTANSRASATACHWLPRPDLPDFLESGRKAGFKRGFLALFSATPGLPGLRLLVSAKGAARSRVTLSAANADAFADFFAGASPELQFEIAHLLGQSGLLRQGDGAAGGPDYGDWLDELPYLEGSGQAGGLSYGLDIKLLADDGQLFIEGWMKNAGAARAPSIRVVLTEAALLRYQVIDQAALREDIAPPGAGGLKRPGFFIIGQSQPRQIRGAASLVLEIQHGGARHWLRLSPQQVSPTAWRNSFVACIGDRARIAPQAHRALLAFFSRPALPCPASPAPPRAAPAIAAICLVDFRHDNPCRGLIVASLARVEAAGLKLIAVTDPETIRSGMALLAPRGRSGGSTHYAETLVEGLEAAALEPHDNVLFLSCATLLRGDPVAAFAGAAAQRAPQATHWLITPRTVREEQVGALRRMLALPGKAPESGAEGDASEAYLDFFVPLVAPSSSVLGLARHWTPPLPALLFREVIRRAVTDSRLGVIRLDSLSSYRQQDEAEARFLRLYRELSA